MSANCSITRHRFAALSLDLAVKCYVFLLLIIGVYAAVVRSTPMDLTTSVDGEKLPNEFRETCQWEHFEPECQPETVIIVDSANYGRRVSHLRQQQQQQSVASWGVVGSRPVTDLPPMSSSRTIGKCIERFYDETDCLADVTQYVASRCSGRRRCSISLPDAVLESSNHRCPRDLKANLEVTYHCLPVHGGYTSPTSSVNESLAVVPQPKSSPWCNNSAVVVTSSRGFLASVSAQESGAGSPSCPWTIQALPGQTIKLAIYYFNANATGNAFQTSGVGRNPRQRFDSSRNNHVPSPCSDATFAHAAVREDMTSSSTVKALCPPIRLDPLASRDPAVYDSNGNILHVIVNNMAPAAFEESYFVMKYEVNGCADFVPPIGSAVERSAGTARLRCLSAEELAAASFSSTTTAKLAGSRDRSSGDAGQSQQQQRWTFLTCVDGNWSIPVETISCVEGGLVIGGVTSSSTSGPWFDMNGYSLSKQGFLVIVVVGIALVVSLFIIVVGIICLCRSQGLHRQSSTTCRQDLPYISGSSSFRRGGSGKTYDASLTSGGHTSDWRNYDPTWKELQPMLTAGSPPVQGGSKCPSISARVRLMNSGGGTGEYGWTCPSSEIGSVGFLDGFPHQDHLERDYATTLQMRRTAVPSSVNFPSSLQRDFDLQHPRSPRHHRHHHHNQSGRRRPQLTAAASSCICPMHGTPSVSDRWAGHHRQQQAWTTDVDSCSMARSTAARDCDDSTRFGTGSNNNNNNGDEVGTARFSTFRPRVEHIYEVPRFDDVGGGNGYGCNDAAITDDVGRKTLEDCEEPVPHQVGTGLNDVDADGRPVPYYRELEPTVFGNVGVRLPTPGQSATGTKGNY